MQVLLLLNSSAVDTSDGNTSLYIPAYIGLTDLSMSENGKYDLLKIEIKQYCVQSAVAEDS